MSATVNMDEERKERFARELEVFTKLQEKIGVVKQLREKNVTQIAVLKEGMRRVKVGIEEVSKLQNTSLGKVSARHK